MALLSNQLRERDHDERNPALAIPPLSYLDVSISPGDAVQDLVAVTSPWIDLASPDPLIYDISRQVLDLEISHAAFCGFGHAIIRGPRLHHGNLHGDGVVRYAMAVRAALESSFFLRMGIWIPVVDQPDAENDDEMGSLAPFAREHVVRAGIDTNARKTEEFGTWDAWNIIRTTCEYNLRLAVGG